MVPAPVGVSTRTRLRVTADELAVLAATVEHTTRLRNTDLRAAVSGESRSVRRKRFGDAAHSRILDTLTADTNDLVATRRRNLRLERAHVIGTVGTLTRRIAAPTRDSCAHPGLDGRKPTRREPCPRCKDGYPTTAERYQKVRRRQVLTARLVRVERSLANGDVSLLPGGRRRLRNRLHLADADIIADSWADEWATARAWCGASGSTGEHGGNRVFKLDPHTGALSITVPRPVAQKFALPVSHARAAGGTLTLATAARFTHHGDELRNRIAGRLGVRFDLEPVYRGGRVVKLYLRASWTREEPPPAPTLHTARDSGLLGVDLNGDHLALARVDRCGNPVGAPGTIALEQRGSTSLRDARLREAITALLDHAEVTGAGTIVIEDLGFADPSTRETTGRGRKGKRFRRTVAGIPTAQLRTRLTAMAARRDITVVCVDPRYTSTRGKIWAPRLSTRATICSTRPGNPVVVEFPDVATGHHGAAVAIARRGLGLRLAPRPTRPAPHPRDGSRPATRVRGGAGVGTRAVGSPVRSRRASQDRSAPTGSALPPPAVGNRPTRPPAPTGGAHAYRPGHRGTRRDPQATRATDAFAGPIRHPHQPYSLEDDGDRLGLGVAEQLLQRLLAADAGGLDATEGKPPEVP